MNYIGNFEEVPQNVYSGQPYSFKQLSQLNPLWPDYHPAFECGCRQQPKHFCMQHGLMTCPYQVILFDHSSPAFKTNVARLVKQVVD